MAIGDELDKLLSDPRLTQDDWEAFGKILGAALPIAPHERREAASKEIRHNYGHSIRNILRNWYEPDYDEIVQATADKLGIKIKDKDNRYTVDATGSCEIPDATQKIRHTVAEIEDHILVAIIEIAKAKIISEYGASSWEKIEHDVEQEIADRINAGDFPPDVLEQIKNARGTGLMAALVAGRLEGSDLYIASLQTFAAITKFVGLPIGVAPVGSAIACVPILFGPAGWIVSAAIFTYEFGNTNWKKTIPSVVTAAIFRRKLGL